MYSYSNRLKAIDLYIQYGESAAATVRVFGYPSKEWLRNWLNGQTPRATMRRHTLPARGLQLGGELIYARKELEDGRSGDLSRLHAGRPEVRVLMTLSTKVQQRCSQTRCYSRAGCNNKTTNGETPCHV